MVSMIVPATLTKRIVGSRLPGRHVVKISSSARLQHHLLVFLEHNPCLVCHDLGIVMDMSTARTDRMSRLHVDPRRVMLAISSVAIASAFLIFGNVMEM